MQWQMYFAFFMLSFFSHYSNGIAFGAHTLKTCKHGNHVGISWYGLSHFYIRVFLVKAVDCERI